MDDEIERIHKEVGGDKEEEGSKGDDNGGDNNAGGGDEREGGHPWRIPLMTTRSTAPLPLDRVILLTPKITPMTMMTKRGEWWEYLSYWCSQWDTWRP